MLKFKPDISDVTIFREIKGDKIDYNRPFVLNTNHPIYVRLKSMMRGNGVPLLSSDGAFLEVSSSGTYFVKYLDKEVTFTFTPEKD